MQTNEFQIPVPWGHIAVKTWGEEYNTPVLLIHGIWDNLGTFDPLIPLLPPAFYYICIDLPSHGLSTHYPPYMFISAIDNVVALKLVIKYINREKYIVIGHSWGGHIAVLFAELYPECCTKLIVLDSMHLVPLSVPFFKQYLRHIIQGIITTGKNTHGERRSYTLQEATNKIRYGRMDEAHLTEKLAYAISTRSVVKNKDQYQFNTDFRLKFHFNFFADTNDFSEMLEKHPLKCPLLIIFTSKMQYHALKGGHDTHGNQPEIVGPIISKFLLKNFCKI